MKKYFIYPLIIALMTGLFVSCSEDDLGPTNFPTDIPEIDITSYTFPLDSFCKANYRIPYNLQFRYKMQDVGADMNYNLVPCTYDAAIDMAVLTKYLWFDVYKKVVDPEFLMNYGPRIIHLIGSPAYNASSGTMVLGLAEGGIKVSLYRLNELESDMNEVDSLNEMYFKTMHHEFSHILHQTKIYPNEFNMISTSNYDSYGWQDRSDSIALSLGFVTQYGGSQPREDFAETIANYIVKDDDTWYGFLNTATYGWEKVEMEKRQYDNLIKEGWDVSVIGHIVGSIKSTDGSIGQYSVVRKTVSRDEEGRPILDEKGEIVYTDLDGVDGKAIILKKLEICRKWLREAYGFELDSLRMEVQKRQYMTNSDGTIMKNPQTGRPVGRLTYRLHENSDRTLIDSLRNQVEELAIYQKEIMN